MELLVRGRGVTKINTQKSKSCYQTHSSGLSSAISLLLLLLPQGQISQISHKPRFCFFKKNHTGSWGDSSAVKSTVRAGRRTWVDSQHPPGGTQLYITPVLGDPCPHLASPATHMHVQARHPYTSIYFLQKEKQTYIRSHSVSQPGLEFATILLFQPPKCQDFAFELPYPVSISLYLLHLNNQLFATSPSKLVI